MTGGGLAVLIILSAFGVILVAAGIADYRQGRYEWMRAVREGLTHARYMSAEEVQCMQDRINEIRESRESKDPALRLRVIALEKRVKTLEAQTATTADSPVSA